MEIYWERQQGNNCRIHSLNAMFGHKFIDEFKFKAECSEYDKIIQGLNSIDMDGFAECRSIISYIVDMNGSSDYLEMFAYAKADGNITFQGGATTGRNSRWGAYKLIGA